MDPRFNHFEWITSNERLLPLLSACADQLLLSVPSSRPRSPLPSDASSPPRVLSNLRLAVLGCGSSALEVFTSLKTEKRSGGYPQGVRGISPGRAGYPLARVVGLDNDAAAVAEVRYHLINLS